MESSNNIEFASVEQAFQYMKTYYSEGSVEVLEALRGRILATTDGAKLRQLGREVPSLDREVWDRESPGIMHDLVLESFRANPAAAEELLATGDAVITHDQDNSRWREEFPRILMQVRDELRNPENSQGEGMSYYSGTVEPGADVVFVFGSNPEGRHGAGAARVAASKFGAVKGVGEGLQGSSYALPTKDLRVTRNHGYRSISEADIMKNIRRMYECAEQNPDRRFMVAYTNAPDEKTLNGYTGKEMIAMFVEADGGRIPSNVVFSEAWREEMERQLVSYDVAMNHAEEIERRGTGMKYNELKSSFTHFWDDNLKVVKDFEGFYDDMVEAFKETQGQAFGKEGYAEAERFVAEMENDMELMDYLTRSLNNSAAKRTLSQEGSLYVSHYGSRNIPEDAYIVQISTTAPKGMTPDFQFRQTYPSWKEMVGPYRDGIIDEKGYTDRYVRDVLDRNHDDILETVKKIKTEAQGRDIYFMCYEKPGDFCHRYLFNNFLNENGIVCQENPADRQRYSVGKVPLYGEPGYGVLVREKDKSVSRTSEQNAIRLEESSSTSYATRTYENANAPEVDFTVAFAVNFGTSGEISTAEAAGDSLVKIQVSDCSDVEAKKAAKYLVDMIADSEGEPLGLNIAGNGMYTLHKSGISQNDIDTFITKVLAGAIEGGLKVGSIRSGGQTGADEAGIVAATVLNIPAVIRAPRGYKYMDAQGKNHYGKEGFMSRFEGKDVAGIRQSVDKCLNTVKEIAAKAAATTKKFNQKKR